MSEPGNDPSAELAALLDAPIDPATLPVRFSRLKRMNESPAHYFAACQARANEETIAMRLGSGVHALVLGMPVKRYSGRRAGKDWDKYERDAKAAEPDVTILNDREWSEASAIASSILRHREAMALLFDGTTVEETIMWEWLGRACSSRPDARGRHHVADLKTARTSKPGLFAREALRAHYHAQLAFYSEANHATGGGYYSNAYLIAVEKTAPYPVTVYRLTDRTLDIGARLNRLWMEQLLACESACEWPAYSDAIVDLDAPEDLGPIEIEINGQLTEVA